MSCHEVRGDRRYRKKMDGWLVNVKWKVGIGRTNINGLGWIWYFHTYFNGWLFLCCHPKYQTNCWLMIILLLKRPEADCKLAPYISGQILATCCCQLVTPNCGDCKGIPRQIPLSSGLGIIVVCQDISNVVRFLFSWSLFVCSRRWHSWHEFSLVGMVKSPFCCVDGKALTWEWTSRLHKFQ